MGTDIASAWRLGPQQNAKLFLREPLVYDSINTATYFLGRG
jgi:hypothetical protein